MNYSNLNKNCFYCAGRPTGRPRPDCRPGRWQRLPASEPAQTGARPGHEPNRPAHWPAQAESQAGRARTRASHSRDRRVPTWWPPATAGNGESGKKSGRRSRWGRSSPLTAWVFSATAGRSGRWGWRPRQQPADAEGEGATLHHLWRAVKRSKICLV